MNKEENSIDIRELSCEQEETIAGLTRTLKIIGHPLRLKILAIMQLKKCKVAGLVNCLNESQPIISQQIAILRNAGIIKGSREKNSITYKIADPFCKELIKKVIKTLENS
ncbi:MAG: winged helix-turn-helix transcriptional regulator [Candidatus Delongbacteria bacterium]|nr:winged helix-turn-helix transcriptional regulator [Candidatus Delongbacteria bacterium]MBN2834721.1 winged helix-turn-helix transcriptional regulator [Candidatus Delongbacteria bacterium]